MLDSVILPVEYYYSPTCDVSDANNNHFLSKCRYYNQNFMNCFFHSLPSTF